jgi:hypothetical protein
MACGASTWSVDTNDKFYAGTGIKFLGICANDYPNYNISQHFNQTSEFIHQALSSSEGKIINKHL